MNINLERLKQIGIYRLQNIICHLPPKTAHSIIYYRGHGSFMNWKTPTTYDEKIHWLLANVYDGSLGTYVDKYQVRSYVEQCGLKELLVPILGVYQKAKDINYDELPEKFVLKTTQGSGKDYYEICSCKKQLNKKVLEKKFKAALQINFARRYGEYQYQDIRPKIICEAFLEESPNSRLDDYKVVCTQGIPRAILVCTNRDAGRDYYSTDWHYLDYVKDEYRSHKLIKKPELLPEMLHAATVLSKPFLLARIDFYITNNKLYFGEITLSPSAGNHHYLNQKGQTELGKMVDLHDFKSGRYTYE